MKKRVHFIGIGGAGLSALARIMLARGWLVSGSDRQPSGRTEALAQEGATIFVGHDKKWVDGADVVVMSSAIAAHNPERVAAEAAGIPLLKRDRWLAKITQGYDLIAVAGTHGKTTTTSMISLMLTHAGLDPTVVVGAEVPQLGGNARTGASRFFVLEADEYDYAFLGLQPAIAVVLNVEYDHPDIFPDEAAVLQAFLQFVTQVRHNGVVVACTDDAGVRQLLQTYHSTSWAIRPALSLQQKDKAGRLTGPTIVTYGLESDSEWQATNLTRNSAGGTDFVALHKGEAVGAFSLLLPGRHVVLNALATIAVGTRLGVNAATIQKTLGGFRGAVRRFQPVGQVRRIQIFDDYAHHPTEVRVTLAAARQQFANRPLWAIFQPHTFSRLTTLYDEFVTAFKDADHVIVSNIYAAREQGDVVEGARALANAIQGTRAVYQGTPEEIIRYALDHLPDDVVVITLGAGDITHLGPRLQRALQEKESTN